MKRVGNLSLSISLEGFEDANDFRRGEGVYDKVLHAMDLLHENGLISETVYAILAKTWMLLHLTSSLIF